MDYINNKINLEENIDYQKKEKLSIQNNTNNKDINTSSVCKNKAVKLTESRLSCNKV